MLWNTSLQKEAKLEKRFGDSILQVAMKKNKSIFNGMRGGMGLCVKHYGAFSRMN